MVLRRHNTNACAVSHAVYLMMPACLQRVCSAVNIFIVLIIGLGILILIQTAMFCVSGVKNVATRCHKKALIHSFALRSTVKLVRLVARWLAVLAVENIFT